MSGKENKVFFHSVWILKHPKYESNILFADEEVKPAVKKAEDKKVCEGFTKLKKSCKNKAKDGKCCCLHC